MSRVFDKRFSLETRVSHSTPFSKHRERASDERSIFIYLLFSNKLNAERFAVKKRNVLKNQPVDEILHAATQSLREVGRDVLHLGDAALEFRQIALHGARFHLTRRGRGENPLRGFGHSAARAARATAGAGAATLMLALIRRQHLPSQKPFSFYLRSAKD